MQVATILLSPLAAIVGVIVGGLITSRVQQKVLARQISASVLRSREEACVEFLAAIRTYRRFIMYTNIDFDEVAPSDTSKGSVAIEGREVHDTRLDQAISKLMIVSQSRDLVALAYQMATDLNKMIRERATVGRGNIPNDVVGAARRTERKFAELAVKELHGKILIFSDPDVK